MLYEYFFLKIISLAGSQDTCNGW